MNTILKHHLIPVILNQAFLSIGSIVIMVLFARYTSQATFGEIRYLIAILTILSFWSLPGISLIINQKAATLSKHELKSLISTQLHYGVYALGGALIFAAFHMYKGDTALAQAFIVSAALTPFANLYLVPGVILAGLKRFHLKFLCDMWIICSTLLCLALVLMYTDTLMTIMGVYFLAQSFSTAVAFVLISRFLPSSTKKRNIQIVNVHTGVGRTLTYLQIPFSFIPAMEKAVVFILLGPIALALFVIATLPAEHFKNAFRNLIQFYMLPHTTDHSPSELIQWFITGAFVLMLGIIGLILFILFGMPLLFPDFNSVQYLALILVVGTIPLPIHILTVEWIAKRTTIKIAQYALYATFLSIVCIVTGSLLGGLIGAIIGKLIHELLLAGGLVYIDYRNRTKLIV